MAPYPPLFARPPLEMRKYFTNMVEHSRSTTPKSNSAQNDHDGKSESLRDDEGQDDVKILRVLGNVRRSLPCGWHDCPSNLSSLENLKKHLRKRHCQPLSSEAIKSTSSSKPYRCHYDSCQNKSFHDPSALFNHAFETHLYPLMLRCPIPKCRYKAQTLGHLVQHFSTTHNTIVEELPRSIITPISTKKLPALPSLPDREVLVLTDLAMVKPNPSFDSSKATRNMKDLLEYSALIEIDDEDDDIPSSPFARIDIPKNVGVEQKVRLIPRWAHSSTPYPSKLAPGLDDLPPLEAETGPTFGYLVWKQRFEKAEKTGELPFSYSSKRRK